MYKKIGFLGTGNMAKAIIEGILKAELIYSDKIYASDCYKEGLVRYSDSIGINPCESNISLVKEADVIFLCIKPNILPEVLKEIKGYSGNKLFISIVMGASVGKIKGFLGEDARVIRTMPNTPALVSEGMTIISYDESINNEEKAIAESIFQNIGKIQIMDERYMNNIVALTSSSPAYFYIMAEAMADAAVLHGIPRDISYKLAAQTMLGSAKMLLETKKHPGELKDMVCSPAGTTIEAVAELEKTGFRNAVISAMKVCTDKANRI